MAESRDKQNCANRPVKVLHFMQKRGTFLP